MDNKNYEAGEQGVKQVTATRHDQRESLAWGPRYTGNMRIALLGIFAAATLSAEFLEIRMEVRDMDCASCAQSMETSLKRMRGVEKVSIVSPTQVEFLLATGNKHTLERFRDAIKGVGFTPMNAKVVVRGKAITAQGQWRFEVDGIGKSYSLAASQTETIQALRKKDGQTITVRAISPLPPDPHTTPSLNVDSLVEAR